MDELLPIPADANSLLCPAFPLQVDLVLLVRELYFQELPAVTAPSRLSQGNIPIFLQPFHLYILGVVVEESAWPQ